MTSTERKLDEARYFLSQLKTHDPYFDYILSAFLNAARSTAWVMRFEFGKINSWDEWFGNTNVNAGEEKLLKEINDLRIQATKQGGVKTEYHFLDEIPVEEKYYPMLKELLSRDGEVKITIEPVDEESIKQEDQKREDGIYSFTFMKDSSKKKSTLRQELYDLCNSYFSFLEVKVEECVNKFASAL